MFPAPGVLSVPLLILLSGLYGLHLISATCGVTLAPNGEVDITKTLYNCSLQMTDSRLVASMKTSTPVKVKTQILLNSLISINEIEGTATLDFFFKLQWVDPRWVIPELWLYLDKKVADQGLAIGPLVLDEDDFQLNMWLPDLQFMDQVGSTLVSESMKFKPKGVISWSRHLSLVLTQPQFDYESYPMDSQNITIRFASPSLANSFVAIEFDTPAIAYINAPYPNEKEYNFPENSIWDHEVGDTWTLVFKETQKRVISSSFSYNRTYDHGIVKIRITRRSDGVLIRLGLPVLLLMILSGFVYWAAMESRIDSTMTILLSVSALYIVVFGNIPLLGYLTTFDRYILVMFLLLTINVVLHQLSFRLSVKTEKWPLRQFFIRLVEFAGRITVIPLALYLFSSMFDSNFVDNVNNVGIIVLTVGMSVILMRESFGVKKAFQGSMLELQYKVDESSIDSLSWYEIIFYYLYFGIVRKLSKKRFSSSSNQFDENDPSRASGFGVELKNKVLDEIHNPANHRPSIDLQPDSDDDDEEVAKISHPTVPDPDVTIPVAIINGTPHHLVLSSMDTTKHRRSRTGTRNRSNSAASSNETRNRSNSSSEPKIFVVQNESTFSL